MAKKKKPFKTSARDQARELREREQREITGGATREYGWPQAKPKAPKRSWDEAA